MRVTPCSGPWDRDLGGRGGTTDRDKERESRDVFTKDLEGERIQRVFDEGNQRSVTAISELKDVVRERLTTDQLIVVPRDIPKGVVEMSSTRTPALQAADIAGGYARTLYVEHGLRVVCEEFKGVILNGAIVRDWTQLERRNLTELRARR
jgi:hypothetical protein